MLRALYSVSHAISMRRTVYICLKQCINSSFVEVASVTGVWPSSTGLSKSRGEVGGRESVCVSESRCASLHAGRPPRDKCYAQ